MFTARSCRLSPDSATAPRRQDISTRAPWHTKIGARPLLGPQSHAAMTTADFDLPAFSAIRIANIEPVLRELLDAHRAQLAALLAAPVPSWDSLVVPLEEMHHRLARTWSPVGHMNGVSTATSCAPLTTPACRCSRRGIRSSRRTNGCIGYETILANEGDRLTAGQRKLLQNALRDFRLAGVALPARAEGEFKALVEQLATLQSKFDENVLDATNAWSRHVTQESEIAGLPQPIVERARAAAQARQLEGWFFTLDAPNYQAVMMHAENEALRREFYQGWVTRASEQGPAPAAGTTPS